MGNSPEAGAADATQLPARPVLSRPSRAPSARAIAANNFIPPNKLYQTKRVCPAPCNWSPSCSRCSCRRRLALARVPPRLRKGKEDARLIASRPFNSLSTTIRSVQSDAGRLTAIMTGKRKRDSDETEADLRVKRQRRRKRSRSEPLLHDSESAEKRQALKRLFGRICSVELDDTQRREPSSGDEEEFGDENEDPLLDSVPVDMDPEQLGFLVCAQETLRFLHGRGIPIEHPVFARLRSRLLRGIGEMAVA